MDAMICSPPQRHGVQSICANYFSFGNRTPTKHKVNRLSADTIGKVLSYLKFDDICRLRQVCTLWNHCASIKFFKRQIQERWPIKPRDYGMGIGAAFTIPSWDWSLRLIARQHIWDSASQTWNLSAQISLMSSEALKRSTSKQRTIHYTLEAARWFSAVFDLHHQDTGALFDTPPVLPLMLENIIMLGHEMFQDRDTQLLMCKAIGILSISESNRNYANSLGFVKYLLKVIMGYRQDAYVIGNAIWALVIVGRPVGGVEGEAYSKTGDENFQNVIAFGRMKGVELLFNVINDHSHDPVLLSKTFWLMVNLALMDDLKMKLIRNMHAIVKIKTAMLRFPSHEELQYRACFALINIAIRPEAKVQIRELRMIPLVVQAAQRFPRSAVIQKTFCNVTRSIISREISSIMINELRSAGALEVLRAIIENFTMDSHIIELADDTICYLEMV